MEVTAEAEILSLAWELLYATGVAEKEKKKEKGKERKEKHCIIFSRRPIPGARFLFKLIPNVTITIMQKSNKPHREQSRAIWSI